MKDIKQKIAMLFYQSSFLGKIVPISMPKPSQYYVDEMLNQKIKNIFKNFQVPNYKKDEKILFLDPRGGEYVRIIYGFIAKRLEYEGYETYFINCEDLPICNNTSIITQRKENICNTCLVSSNNLMDSFGLHYTTLNKLISDDIRTFAFSEIKKLNVTEILNYSIGEFDLGNYIEVSVCSYLFRGNVKQDDPQILRIMRDFLYGLIVLFHSYNQLINKYNPSKIITVNGRFFWHKLAYEIAKSKGIPIITMDDFGSVGGTGNRWMFSHDKAIAELELSTYWKDWEKVELTISENDFLTKNFIDGAIKNKIYFNTPINDWEFVEAKLNIKRFEYDVLFTNLTWDSTVIGNNIFFDDMLDWIIETIKFYIKKKKKLIIRVHPAEKGIFGYPSLQKVSDEIYNIFPQLPDNIILVNSELEINSYMLLKYAVNRLVYASTIGLEAAVRGLPVIVAGKVHYRNKGFTIDPYTKNEYFDVISNSSNTKECLTKEEIELAKRYAFFYLYRTKIPLEFYTAEHFHVKNIRINSYKEILPGHNKFLDLVINGILTGKPIVLPREYSNKLLGLKSEN